MSNTEIRELLQKLQEEIRKTELDADTRSLFRSLDEDIHELLESEAGSAGTDTLLKRARQLEAKFATDHPTAERFMREVIDTLGRMGI